MNDLTSNVYCYDYIELYGIGVTVQPVGTLIEFATNRVTLVQGSARSGPVTSVTARGQGE
jgi:hypothetical protein